MLEATINFFQSMRKPHIKEVFFPSLPFNRKVILWYADKLVKKDSVFETPDRLRKIDQLRMQRNSLTFICNHLTYADSHIVETLMIRNGFRDLADHLIHIAGQKTYSIGRRFFTRSLNSVRVYQPKAKIDKSIAKKMNSRALKWAAHLKRRGYSLILFPEGTRTRRHKQFNLYSANPKATIYFRRSYVVPLALMGSEKIMPVGNVFQRTATVHLRVGEPALFPETEEALRKEHPDKTDKEMRQVLMLHYMNRINELLEPDYRFQEREEKS